MLRSLLNITLPQADYRVATGTHVGVLRFVQGHASALSHVRLGKTFGMAVPVVSIKLHDQARHRHEGVNAEPTAYQVLGEVLHPKRVQHRISLAFKPVDFGLGLGKVHAYELRASRRISVPAFKAAIHGIAVGDSGRRAKKRCLAGPAFQNQLAATLPSQLASLGAKTSALNSRALGDVEGSFAYLAFPDFAQTRTGATAGERANLSFWRQVAGDNCSANCTDNCAKRILRSSVSFAFLHLFPVFHLFYVSFTSATNKAAALVKWCFGTAFHRVATTAHQGDMHLLTGAMA